MTIEEIIYQLKKLEGQLSSDCHLTVKGQPHAVCIMCGLDLTSLIKELEKLQCPDLKKL